MDTYTVEVRMERNDLSHRHVNFDMGFEPGFLRRTAEGQTNTSVFSKELRSFFAMRIPRVLIAAVVALMSLPGCVSTQPVAAELTLDGPLEMALPRQSWPWLEASLCIELVEHPNWNRNVPNGVLRIADGTLVHLNMKVVHKDGRTTNRNPGGWISYGSTNICWLPVNDPYTDARSVTLSSDHPVALRRIWWYHAHGK